jgi:polyisoprenoid-binding protein YceI
MIETVRSRWPQPPSGTGAASSSGRAPHPSPRPRLLPAARFGSLPSALAGFLSEATSAGRAGARAGVLALAVAASAAPMAAADPVQLTLDPAASEVRFSLGAVLHTVHGGFRLERGRIVFDPAGGAASGEVAVDLASGDTGNQRRDRDMHRKVLESERFPQAVLTVEAVEGALPADGASAELTLRGVLALHGGEHPVEVAVEVSRSGDRVEARARLTVPYVEWGLEDPSSFVLRVDKEVEVEVTVGGTLSAGPGSGARHGAAGPGEPTACSPGPLRALSGWGPAHPGRAPTRPAPAPEVRQSRLGADEVIHPSSRADGGNRGLNSAAA